MYYSLVPITYCLVIVSSQLEGKVSLVPNDDNFVSLTVSKYGIKIISKTDVGNCF